MLQPHFRLGVVILAAGAAERFGSPKQLQVWQGETFLHRAFRATTSLRQIPSCAVHTVIVLGAHSERIRQAVMHTMLSNDEVPDLVDNPLWHEGMGSSIRCGVQHLLPTLPDAILIWTCDQVLVGSAELSALVHAHREHGNGITACRYADTYGIPAVFSSSFFDELSSLNHSHGAKRIIAKHLPECTFVQCEAAAMDVDTPDDFEQALSLWKRSRSSTSDV